MNLKISLNGLSIGFLIGSIINFVLYTIVNIPFFLHYSIFWFMFSFIIFGFERFAGYVEEERIIEKKRS